MILGLDISTSITGYTILDNDGNIIVCNHIDLRKEKNFFQKCSAVEGRLTAIRNDYFIEHIYVEQPFMFFNSGGSSAVTMAVLQRFNGVVSWLCYNLFGIEPQYLTAKQARDLCGIKVPRGQKAKDVALQFVLDNVPSFDIEYTRYGNPKAGYTDRSDSYVIAKAGWINGQQET